MGIISNIFHFINSGVVEARDILVDTVAEITEDRRAMEGISDYISGQSSVKLKMPKRSGKVLAATDLVLREKTYQVAPKGDDPEWDALDRTLLDTTTYPDRALVTLTNNRGFAAFLVSMTLYGKRIMQYSGEGGELIHDSLKRDDDIRRNGEKVFEVGNEFIVDATQCANIADYWYKFLGKKKHMYAVSIPGCAYWYEVGDWYNFQVGEADTNEYIDTTVEVYAVDVEKSAGGIGSTSLLLREVEESWAKSTLYATRLATGGSPKRRVNRSNIVTVASSEYDGTYDYKCDGTDDDVQIQAAIDYVSATFGGGTIQLTHGSFNIEAQIDLIDNIKLIGEGEQTILIIGDYDSGGATIGISAIGNGIHIESLQIDGNDTVRSVALVAGVYSDNTGYTTLNNVHVTKIINSSDTGLALGFYGSNNDGPIIACVADYISVTTASGGATAKAAGFNFYNRATNCYANQITATGTGAGYGFRGCKSCQNNRADNCTTAEYFASYADSGTTDACSDAAVGGYNS